MGVDINRFIFLFIVDKTSCEIFDNKWKCFQIFFLFFVCHTQRKSHRMEQQWKIFCFFTAKFTIYELHFRCIMQKHRHVCRSFAIARKYAGPCGNVFLFAKSYEWNLYVCLSVNFLLSCAIFISFICLWWRLSCLVCN